jgi:hypothetical protein
MREWIPNWPAVNEEDRPFGLAAGETIDWKGLTVTRKAVLGPNWQYIVLGKHRGFRVNVFKEEPGMHRMLIHGLGRGGIASLYLREALEVSTPTEAVTVALNRAVELDLPPEKASEPSE